MEFQTALASSLAGYRYAGLTLYVTNSFRTNAANSPWHPVDVQSSWIELHSGK